MAFAHEELTKKILEACFEVSHSLGAGFLESVYLNALVIALQEKGLRTNCEVPYPVMFRKNCVGTYKADLVVCEVVLVELKAVNSILPEHKAQVINYLKASGLEVGMLINFGKPKIEFFRLEHPNLRLQIPSLNGGK
jgi:GxxExxY protein